MAEKRHKIELIFIINGEDFDVEAHLDEVLSAAVEKALHKSRNTGRPADEWEVRNAEGVLLEQARTIAELGLKNRERLFLSLRVGAGGS